MQCRRCGEHTMPGLAACFACGLPATADPEPQAVTPGQFTPRVRTTNPLKHSRKVRPTRAPLINPPTRQVLGAALLGMLPGLAAARRGQIPLAIALTCGALVSAAFIVVPELAFLAIWGVIILNSVVLTAALSEAYARRSYPEPFNMLATLGFSLTLMFLFRLAFWYTLNATMPMVRLQPVVGLRGGSCLTRPLDAPALNTLVSTTGEQRFSRGRDIIAPILALPGQTVDVQNGRPLVDGDVTSVTPVGAGFVSLPRGEPFVVPPESIVLYADPLKPVPVHAVREVFYRWAPIGLRGPVQWPPPPPETP